MPKELFGTDGIRGVPGTPPLDDATLFATGRSLAAYLLREHSAAHALIGMDTRESGPHIAALLAAGLQHAGATVAFAGVITTQASPASFAKMIFRQVSSSPHLTIPIRTMASSFSLTPA